MIRVPRPLAWQNETHRGIDITLFCSLLFLPTSLFFSSPPRASSHICPPLFSFLLFSSLLFSSLLFSSFLLSFSLSTPYLLSLLPPSPPPLSSSHFAVTFFITHVEQGVNNRWEFFVSGAPLLQVTMAEHQAAPGDIILSNESWKMVRDNCEGEALPSGDTKLVAVSKPIPARKAPPLKLDSRIEASLSACESPLSFPLLTCVSFSGLLSFLFLFPALTHSSPYDRHSCGHSGKARRLCCHVVAGQARVCES